MEQKINRLLIKTEPRAKTPSYNYPEVHTQQMSQVGSSKNLIPDTVVNSVADQHRAGPRLISEPPKIQPNDYRYFKKLFGSANDEYLFGDLTKTIKKIKRDYNKAISFKETPEDVRQIEQKEEFKQDVIFGNSLRH